MSVITSPRLAAGGTLRSRSAGIGLALILTVQLMLILDMTVVNVALPPIQRDLHFSSANLSWVLNAYTLAFGGLLLLGGRVGDIIGRRRAFLTGLGLFAAASLAGGLAQSAAWLVTARTIQGVGAAIAAPSVLALVATLARSDGERLRNLSLFSAVSSAGASIGLVVGGLLTAYASWRWSLFINVPLAAVVLVLGPRYIAETDRRPARLDVVGALTATAGSSALVYGVIHAPDHGWTDPVTVLSLVVGALLIGAFILAERRVRQPLLQLDILRDRQRWGAAVTMAFIVGAQFALFFFTVQFMQLVLGYGALKSGIAFLPLSLSIFAMSRVAPRLAGRFGLRTMIMTGASLLLLANLWLAQLTETSGYLSDLLVPFVMVGVGAGLSFMPITTAVLAGVAPEHAGSASGIVQMAQQVGGSVGLAVLVTVYDSHRKVGDFASGLAPSFYVAAGLFAVAVLVAWRTIGRGRDAETAREAAQGELLEADAAGAA